MGAMAEMMINRTDYGLSYGADGDAVSKEVRVILNAEAEKTTAK